MKFARPTQRILAYWADFLFTVTFVFACGRIFWEIVPGSEIRADAMQLYTEKDFRNFVVTAIFCSVFLIFYNLLMPRSRYQGTFGQYLFAIRLTEIDGSVIHLSTSCKRLVMVLLKYFLIVGLGPLMAYLGFNLAISLTATLIAMVLILTFFSFLAWRDPQGAGPLERICDFRYVSKG